ncbi:hypothetical protein CGK04_23145, partial [Vibrio parahaemolyticus]
MSLEETKASLLAASETADGLLAQINDLYIQEIRTEEKILKEALSELHNSGEIDLVEIVRGVDKSSNGYDFFTTLHAFESALPLLNASVDDVLRCLVHLTQQDGSSGVYGAFERFCRAQASRPRYSVGFILAQSELSTYAPFLSSSILAYDSNHVTEAIQTIENLIADRHELIRRQAYFTLGRLDVGETQANVIWRILNNSARNECDSDCCASILKSMLCFGQTFPSYWQPIEDILLTFVEGASPEVIYEISDIVAFQRVALPQSVLELLVKQLFNVSPEHNSTVSNINYVLVKLVKSGSTSVAVELLESILAVGVEIT